MRSDRIARFLVELYLQPDTITAATDAANATDALIRLIEVISVPEDETCFLVVEAADEATVATFVQRARLRVNRISSVVTDP